MLEGGVCDFCWRGLPVSEDGRCGRCDEALPGAPDGAACGRCLVEPPPFESLRAAAPYRGSARNILLAFKFDGADYLGPRMADAMVRRLGMPAPPGLFEIAAVPATPRARRARGYHPASVLAAALARRLSLPFVPGRLVKVRDTEVQSRVPAAGREANVRRAFEVQGAPPEGVLLVDDVATSGATARECARRLRAAGVRRVAVWCFARASRADVGEVDALEVVA